MQAEENHDITGGMMHYMLRIQVGREFLNLLEHGTETKAAFLYIKKRWGVTRRTIYRYVQEVRSL